MRGRIGRPGRWLVEERGGDGGKGGNIRCAQGRRRRRARRYEQVHRDRRRVHGLGRNLRWQQAQSPGLLNCDIAPLPLPPLGRQWFFASEEAAADVAIACNVQLVPPAPPSARSEALSLASTLKKRVTKMNKHKARKRRKRDRMKKRTN